MPYLASAYSDFNNAPLQMKKTEKMPGICFSLDGLYRLIRVPIPYSSAFKMHSMHSHTVTLNVLSCMRKLFDKYKQSRL